MSNKIYSIDELKTILAKILKDTVVEKAILFGSYAKNCPTETSDIDLIIDSNGKLLNINFYGLLEELVEQLNKNIDLFEITEIQKDSDIYKNIQKEGVVLYEK
jgi:predicted nucleotidyltransferase